MFINNKLVELISVGIAIAVLFIVMSISKVVERVELTQHIWRKS
jgi:hypothetical protein